MSKKEILLSRLLEPGTMFTVTDAVKDSIFPPGSLGFICHIKGVDDSYQNLARIFAVMIRKGKSGKDRVVHTSLFVPIFYVDHEGFNKLLPKEGDKKCYVHIDRELPLATDVMQLTPMAFLGHAVALSRWIKHMSDQCKHKKWPEGKSHPVNIVKRLPDIFEEDPDEFIGKYTTDEFRVNFTEEARRMISSLVRMQIQLDMKRADTEVNAAEFLIFTNNGEFIPGDAKDKENEYKFTDDDSMLKRTLAYHKKIRKDVEVLFKNKKTKK
jgi:hypothetical protein